MIVAQIAARSGRVLREVERRGDEVEVTVRDDDGREVRVALNRKGQVMIDIEHEDPTKIVVLLGGARAGVAAMPTQPRGD